MSPSSLLNAAIGSFYSSYVLPAYAQRAYLMPVIGKDTPGAFESGMYSDEEGYDTVFTDQTFGIGWSLRDGSGTIWGGYGPPQMILCAINDSVKMEQITEQSITTYMTPAVVYMPPVEMHYKDLLVADDGRRFSVENHMTPNQVFGQTYARVNRLELHDQDSFFYQIPVPTFPGS